MKFLHTADWHLGRIFHQVHLTDDQAVVLGQIANLAHAERVDAVLVAGDLYDRAVPPPEAVALLDRTWARLALEVGVPVIAISGNHDSATRIGYGAALLARSGLHLVADLDAAMRPISLGTVDVFALPYAEPAEVRAWSGEAGVRDHASAMQVCLDGMRAHFVEGRARVLVAHAFVSGQRTSESERPLTVGGAGDVPATLFDGFDYVALGHLHAPQIISPRCAYAGSPLKYSFSEADHHKSALIVELAGDAPPSLRAAPLTARRAVRQVEGNIDALLAAGRSDPQREDYLRITLTDEGALLNALGRLREVYPNVLQLDRRFLQGHGASAFAGARRREASDADMLGDFYREVLGVDPDERETALFNEVLEELRREEQEATGAAASHLAPAGEEEGET